MVRNFFTIDVEEWYHVNYGGVNLDRHHGTPTNLDTSMDRLMELCDQSGVKSTCFVLGKVALEKPDVVRKLHAAGHEIASHGFGHQPIHAMTPESFREDVRKAGRILEDITGESVAGFRAPSWSVTREVAPWFYGILEDEGYQYSSSVFPGKTFLYGIADVVDEPHNPIVDGRNAGILEIPCPVTSFLGRKIGFYVRLFPSQYMIRFIEKRNRQGKSVFIYVHPREIDLEQPRLRLPFNVSLIHYWGLRRCEKRIERVLGGIGHGLVRMRDFVEQRASLSSGDVTGD